MATLDNRGCEPPEPLQRTLAALADLGPDEPLIAQFDRRPMMLYPLLHERGLEWAETDEGESVRLVITRKPAD